MSFSTSVQPPGLSDRLSSDIQSDSSMDATESTPAPEPLSTPDAHTSMLTPPASETADPSFEPSKDEMTILSSMPGDVRSIVRLLQCHQCSLPLRAPVTLPCGNNLCSQYCLPERFKRENISFPMTAARMEGFICPFKDCGQEHSVADCAQDVTLTKVIERFALELAEHREMHNVLPTLLEEKLRPRTERELLQLEAAGVSGPQPNSITLSGGALATTYTMAEQGLLRYDSEVSYTPNPTFITTESVSPSPSFEQSDSDLNDILFTHLSLSGRNEVDCQLCWNLLYDPLTTPCGHTFCRSCVARMLDHSTSCPFCRKPLQLPPGVRDVKGNRRLAEMIPVFWGSELETRKAMIAADLEAMKTDIPIFVCTLAYPGMPTFLHIFEPRYRLMMRRVLESETKCFGMVMYNSRGTPQGEELGPNCVFMRQGTLLRIDATAMLPDGRSLIEAHGVSRFNVASWRESDGYVVGRIERFDDVSLETEERLEAEAVQRAPAVPETDGEASGTQVDPVLELETLPTVDLLRISTDFVQRMRLASAPWLNERMLESYGQPPVDDARVFPYWFASVLPISEEEKYELLGMCSVRERLKRTARWVRRIEAQRWYSVSNCNIA